MGKFFNDPSYLNLLGRPLPHPGALDFVPWIDDMTNLRVSSATTIRATQYHFQPTVDEGWHNNNAVAVTTKAGVTAADTLDGLDGVGLNTLTGTATLTASGSTNTLVSTAAAWVTYAAAFGQGIGDAIYITGGATVGLYPVISCVNVAGTVTIVLAKPGQSDIAYPRSLLTVATSTDFGTTSSTTITTSTGPKTSLKEANLIINAAQLTGNMRLRFKYGVTWKEQPVSLGAVTSVSGQVITLTTTPSTYNGRPLLPGPGTEIIGTNPVTGYRQTFVIKSSATNAITVCSAAEFSGPGATPSALLVGTKSNVSYEAALQVTPNCTIDGWGNPYEGQFVISGFSASVPAPSDWTAVTTGAGFPATLANVYSDATGPTPVNGGYYAGGASQLTRRNAVSQVCTLNNKSDIGHLNPCYPIRFESSNGGAASWTESTKTLKSTGAFTNYTFTSGDFFEVTPYQNGNQPFLNTPIGWAPGVYPIASKTDNDNIVLGNSITNKFIIGNPSYFSAQSIITNYFPTAVASTDVTGTILTCTGAFTNYTWASGDTFAFTGASDAAFLAVNAAGFAYTISSKTNNDTIVLSTPCTVGVTTNKNIVGYSNGRDSASMALYARGGGNAALVANYPGSFWQDRVNGVVYVQYLNSASPIRNNPSHATEALFENFFTGVRMDDVDDVKLEGAHLRGWGMSMIHDAGYQGYAWASSASGSNNLLVKDCISAYFNRHAGGMTNGYSGGILTVYNCDFGFGYEDMSVPGYSSTGGQDYWMAYCRAIGPVLPRYPWSMGNGSLLAFGHGALFGGTGTSGTPTVTIPIPPASYSQISGRGTRTITNPDFNGYEYFTTGTTVSVKNSDATNSTYTVSSFTSPVGATPGFITFTGNLSKNVISINGINPAALNYDGSTYTVYGGAALLPNYKNRIFVSYNCSASDNQAFMYSGGSGMLCTTPFTNVGNATSFVVSENMPAPRRPYKIDGEIAIAPTAIISYFTGRCSPFHVYVNCNYGGRYFYMGSGFLGNVSSNAALGFDLNGLFSAINTTWMFDFKAATNLSSINSRAWCASPVGVQLYGCHLHNLGSGNGRYGMLINAMSGSNPGLTTNQLKSITAKGCIFSLEGSSQDTLYPALGNESNSASYVIGNLYSGNFDRITQFNSKPAWFSYAGSSQDTTGQFVPYVIQPGENPRSGHAIIGPIVLAGGRSLEYHSDGSPRDLGSTTCGPKAPRYRRQVSNDNGSLLP